MIGCLVAATVVKIDKVVTAQGKLVSTVPTQMMQPLQTSIVRNIYVRRGQIVHKGQLLAELDPTFAMADSHADQEQVDSYTAQIERLQAQIGNKPYVPSSANAQSELQLETYNQLQAQYLYGVKNFDQQIAAFGLEGTWSDNCAHAISNERPGFRIIVANAPDVPPTYVTISSEAGIKTTIRSQVIGAVRNGKQVTLRLRITGGDRDGYALT